ncbi:unnamed protein product [Protopolystoma xenopodis]|uniref:Secreted protein n=1 Tax=Protopolystoma xenopodis TaxID=117903 RepID=A0A3S4ZSV7_9PLAT|nr:unnamed protein product [Protopolystoma xenopodis]
MPGSGGGTTRRARVACCLLRVRVSACPLTPRDDTTRDDDNLDSLPSTAGTDRKWPLKLPVQTYSHYAYPQPELGTDSRLVGCPTS